MNEPADRLERLAADARFGTFSDVLSDPGDDRESALRALNELAILVALIGLTLVYLARHR